MIKPMDITPEIILALARLRLFAGDESRNSLNTVSREAALAIDVLDNVGFFAVIDEVTGYAAPEDVLAAEAEAAVPNTLDPAEWGDTTSADVARRQGLTGTGHDSSVCDAGPLASPSQHSGTCPTWARHHGLVGGTPGSGKSAVEPETAGEEARRMSGADEWEDTTSADQPPTPKAHCKSCGMRVADGSDYHKVCRPFSS